jgi:asparagine synthase (glutamine-hydrolysing)
VGAWLRGPYRHLLDEYVLGGRAAERGLFEPATVRELVRRHCEGGENHGERLWALVTFEMWQRAFLDGETPSAVLPEVRPAAAVA